MDYNENCLIKDILNLPIRWKGFLLADQYRSIPSSEPERSGLSKSRLDELPNFNWSEYDWQNVPIGLIICHLDCKCYISDGILKCFVRTVNNECYQLSAFWNNGYKPSKDSISVKEVKVGSWLQIFTSISLRTKNVKMTKCLILRDDSFVKKNRIEIDGQIILTI